MQQELDEVVIGLTKLVANCKDLSRFRLVVRLEYTFTSIHTTNHMLKNGHEPIELLASSEAARQWSPENTTQNNKGSLCTYKLHTHQL